jgi:hypothetical protein
MKKYLLTTSLLMLALSHNAYSREYPQNPVLRPLTLSSSTIEVTGAYAYGKQHDKDTDVAFSGNINYGLTDSLQLGLDGITYSILKDHHSGFELAAKAGITGYFDDDLGDSLGLGSSIIAKQIINDNLAFTFSAGYTHWSINNLDNKSEFDYTVGALFNIAPDVTLATSYTFRDLKDFKESTANKATVALNYAYSSNIDLGIGYQYSNFNEQYNNQALQETPEKMFAAYVSYRF